MTRSASISQLTSEFDDFLFAPIGDERNGMLLSVLSALARLGVDPWLEAAHLTHMPEETATERMASLIAALPDRPSAQPDSASVAARLIALLPRGNATNKALRAPTPDGPAAAKSQTILFVTLWPSCWAHNFSRQAANRRRRLAARLRRLPAPSRRRGPAGDKPVARGGWKSDRCGQSRGKRARRARRAKAIAG